MTFPADPLISVVIVTHNRCLEVIRALKSVIAQTYGNREIIVIDNGSRDGTGEALRRQFPEITYRYLPENVGCPEGRNRGIQLATGEWLFFLDDDAWCPPDHLARALAILREAPPGVKVLMPQIQEWIQDQWQPRFHTGRQQWLASFSGGVSLIHRSVFQEIGLYPDTLYGAEEKYLAVQLITRGRQILLDPSLTVYHQPSDSRSPGDLFRQKVQNDMLWVLRFAPRWLALPSLAVKSLVWLQAGLRRGHFRAGWRGCGKGWKQWQEMFRGNRRLTTSAYWQYIRFRKQVKREIGPA
ncbi:MAG: glycosyltransferase family 2 protein [Candidatus Neomarinimicrobiota bacterium]|nr:MAG: glycosyltransferase family 2 protein [Candidatus Neomarinimicrobiota bacterium]